MFCYKKKEESYSQKKLLHKKYISLFQNEEHLSIFPDNINFISFHTNKTYT